MLKRTAKELTAEFGLDAPDLRDVPDPRSLDDVKEVLLWKPAHDLGRSITPQAHNGTREELRRLRSLSPEDLDAPSEALDLLDRLEELDESQS